MAKKETKVSFEKNMEKLHAIVQSIESGDLGLEEMIKKYEEGVLMIKSCREILDEAELKINKLLDDSDKTVPFKQE
ncbi:MAG TPA: exodeoxyribonuclease VII small subunit [bacterium]|nr:exodeoxyribonuclease VII small subunit [bacterium]